MDGIPALVQGRSRRLTFEEFYEREFPRVYRAVWLLAGDKDDAEEATQEAFGRAFARWRSLRKEEWVAGWVITTARNWLRRRGRAQVDLDVIEKVSEGPSADAVDLRRALRQLPRRQRQALVLFYVGDLPVRAVAESMRISDGAVKAHLAQGREALRKHLEIRHG